MRAALRVLFPGILWWMAALIPLVALAFYATYFSRLLFAGGLFHVHFAAWMLWIVLLVAQPLLILRGSRKFHRILGKITFVVAPAVAIITWMVIARSAMAMMESDSRLNALEKEAIFIPVLFLTWFALFLCAGNRVPATACRTRNLYV